MQKDKKLLLHKFFIDSVRFIPLVFCWLIAAIWLSACKAQDAKSHQANRLLEESSPYLQQHAYNPVDWYPWGPEALDQAESSQKLMVISIGYAACHWCHVMEEESFEDSTVAALMNEHFVSIKVDREERPDLDDIYMTACQLMSRGGCGWPLNVITLPDQRPIFAGTYFPRDQWMSILQRVQELYQSDPQKALGFAEQLTQNIQALQGIVKAEGEAPLTLSPLSSMTSTILANEDTKYGGGKGAPKFPMPSKYQYLLQYAHLSENTEAFDAVDKSLEQIAYGGIYDHLGGGFARYSTDAAWKVPHFEKMLYDNAQLVSLYLAAYQYQGKELYKTRVEETLRFIEREMTHPAGAFYSSLDADSEGEEGKFYVWTYEEIKRALGTSFEAFTDFYQLSEKGNWEHGKNILYQHQSLEAFAAKRNEDPVILAKAFQQAKAQLLTLRNKRTRPGLDDKIITAWNALMLKAYVDAYRALGDAKYLASALKNANFLLENAVARDYQLTRIHKEGKSSVNAFLDDYMLLAEAFTSLYQATFDEQWLLHAKGLVDYALAHFYHEDTGMFYYTSDLDEKLVSRQIDMSDNVIPGSNSTACKVLKLLGTYLADETYLQKSLQMLNNLQENLLAQPEYHSNWAQAYLLHLRSPFEVAIVGEQADIFRQQLDQFYNPDVLMLGGKAEGKLALLQNKLLPGHTMVYVCRDKVCKLPVREIKKAQEVLGQERAQQWQQLQQP